MNGEIISVEFSEWDMVDNGGGKFQREFEDTEFHYEILTEERERDTWSKETEFKYNNWKDITNFNFNLNDNALVLDVYFTYEIKLDDDTKKI